MKPNFSQIKTRRDFNDFFDAIFKKTYADLKNRQKLEYEETLPKSYIVEFNPGEDPKNNDVELFKKFLKEEKEELGLSVKETKDPTLTLIETKFGEFIIDSFDSRFLFFHTLSKSQNSNRFIFGNLIRASFCFDSAWFTVQFLEKLSESVNVIEGWDARFNPIVDLSEIEKPFFTNPKISVSIDEPNSWERYNRNKEMKFFEDLPLDTLRIRRMNADGEIARARIQSDGKLTGRGTSFQEYLNIALEIKNLYKETVLKIEDEFSIKFIESDFGIKFEGKPFCITFSKRIEKFDNFIKTMFSCALPFRLLGIPERIKDNYYKVNAIDLHIASRITFEITPDFMRIYLPDSTCGNSILRIIRSLQHKADPNLSIQEL